AGELARSADHEVPRAATRLRERDRFARTHMTRTRCVGDDRWCRSLPHVQVAVTRTAARLENELIVAGIHIKPIHCLRATRTTHEDGLAELQRRLRKRSHGHE